MKRLFPDLDGPDRELQIRAEAVKKEVMSYEKPLTEEEEATLKEELYDLSMRLFNNEQAKKKAMEEFQMESKPLEIQKKQVLTSLKHKTITMEGEVFQVPDHQARMMYFVDAEGNIINYRNLLAEERQLSIEVEAKMRKAL